MFWSLEATFYDGLNTTPSCSGHSSPSIVTHTRRNPSVCSSRVLWCCCHSLHLCFGLALAPFLVLWVTSSSSQPAPSLSATLAPPSPAICLHPTSSFHLSPVFPLLSSTYLSSLPFTQRNPFLPSLPLLRLLPPPQLLLHSSALCLQGGFCVRQRMGWCIPSCTSYPSCPQFPLPTMLCVAYKQAQDHILRGSSVETYMQLRNLSIF